MKQVNYAIVFLTDMNRSVAFYRDVLDLPLKFDSSEWTEFATEGTTLALHTTQVANSDSAVPSQTPAGRCYLGFRVDNLAEFHQRMLGQGVPCIQAPKEEFGIQLAKYADPDGLTLSFSEAPKESARG